MLLAKMDEMNTMGFVLKDEILVSGKSFWSDNC